MGTVLVLVLVAGAGFALASGHRPLVATVSGAAGSGASGTWKVTDQYPSGPVGDVYTFSRRGNSDIYDVTNEIGFHAVASIGPTGGAATLEFNSDGCSTCDHYIEPLTFKISGNGKSTFSGSFKQIHPNGEVGYTGKVRGVRAGARSAKVQITGGVFAHVCKREPKCDIGVKGVADKAVVLTGNGTTSTTETDDNGAFSFAVKRGRYTISVPGKPGNVMPGKIAVNAQSNVAHVDFSICKKPAGYTGPKLACDLVEIDGTAVDAGGSPYATVNVSTSDDFGQTDAGGHFVLFAPAGQVDVTASSYYPPNNSPSSTVTIHAVSGRVSTAELKIPAALYVFGTSGQLDLTLSAPILPPPETDVFAFALQSGTVGATGCASRGQLTLTKMTHGSHPQWGWLLNITPADAGSSNSTFCSGSYTATLSTATGAQLASGTFTVP
jgi:hypothetical protein